MAGGILGIDLGSQRTGFAYAPGGVPFAEALETVELRGRRHLVEVLERLRSEHPFDRIVVGLPVTLKGEEGPAAQGVRETVAWLRERFETRWEFVDERLTTAEVNRMLDLAGVGHRRRKAVRDSLAAQRILQTYLEMKRDD